MIRIYWLYGRSVTCWPHGLWSRPHGRRCRWTSGAAGSGPALAAGGGHRRRGRRGRVGRRSGRGLAVQEVAVGEAVPLRLGHERPELLRDPSRLVLEVAPRAQHELAEGVARREDLGR